MSQHHYSSPLYIKANPEWLRNPVEMRACVRGILKQLNSSSVQYVCNDLVDIISGSDAGNKGEAAVFISCLIFEKAIDHIQQAELYARLCRLIKDNITIEYALPTRNMGPGYLTFDDSFSQQLCKLCQEQFDQNFGDVRPTWVDIGAHINPPSDNTLSGEDVDHAIAMKQNKRQALGNMKFIAELFGHNLIPQSMMANNIRVLLDDLENDDNKYKIEGLRLLLSSFTASKAANSLVPEIDGRFTVADRLTLPRDRTPSKHGEKPEDNQKTLGGGQDQGDHNPYRHQMLSSERVKLQATENHRRKVVIKVHRLEIVHRKVKGLLNKLTTEKFDSISDQIITWANKGEREKNGRILICVIRLIFDTATDDLMYTEVYARLCRKIMEQISPKVQDDGIKNNEGKLIAGGQLFRKYLLNRCQEDFERGWVAKEETAAAAAAKATDDQAAKATKQKTKEAGKGVGPVLHFDEYYAAQKAKRQGLGLIKFIGELFKLQMLTERIMHECVKKLLVNVDNPEEEEIESLCKLLTTVGGVLDTPKARAHLDVYFSRMKELTKNPYVSPRMQYMLFDLIELRDRKWVARQNVAAPMTIAKIHEKAAKEKAATEKELYQRLMSMSRGSTGPPRPPPNAGDLSNFGKISKSGTPMNFGPSSVFASKKGPDASKHESISRTSSSSNMFSMLSTQAAEAADAPKVKHHRRLVLQPRSKPLETKIADAESATPWSGIGGLEEEATSMVELMTEKTASKRIAEDTKEFFAVRNLDEAKVYFSALPAQFHHKLVDSLISKAVESKEADAQLVSDFFARSTAQCSAAAFEEGFLATAEAIDDIAIDAPEAVKLFGLMLKGAKLDEGRTSTIAASRRIATLAWLYYNSADST